MQDLGTCLYCDEQKNLKVSFTLKPKDISEEAVEVTINCCACLMETKVRCDPVGYKVTRDDGEVVDSNWW